MSEVVIHCSATRPSQDIGVAEIRRWHLARGWSDVGYHAVIRKDGRLEPGRSWWLNGAHVKGHNKGTIAVCMVGGLDRSGEAREWLFPVGQSDADRVFNWVQFEALAALCGLMQRSNRNTTFLGHRDYSPDLNKDGRITPDEWLKNCPCFDVAAFLRHYDIQGGTSL